MAPALVGLIAAGCSSGAPRIPGVDVYLEKDIHRVAVLPPFLETLDPAASRQLWPYIVEAVASRGYQVTDPKRIEAFYDKNRFFSDPAEIKIYTASELAREFEVEAILYSNITRWGFSYVLVHSKHGVEAQFELVDGKSEDRLWYGEGKAVDARTVRGGNTGEMAFSLLEVLGNAFLSSKAYAGDACVQDGISKMPMAGRRQKPAGEITGTKAEEKSSDHRPPDEASKKTGEKP